MYLDIPKIKYIPTDNDYDDDYSMFSDDFRNDGENNEKKKAVEEFIYIIKGQIDGSYLFYFKDNITEEDVRGMIEKLQLKGNAIKK